MLKALYPQIIILILTTFNDVDYIIEALNYGASGYILKDIEGDELIKAINDAYKGSMMLPSTLAKKLVQSLSSNPKFKPIEKKLLLIFQKEKLKSLKCCLWALIINKN
ncbi:MULTISPECIES: response regulator transcription factor [Clostridium]|uniref:Stage 0 sporulation protein A homolog n=1 Tax=Clostridium ragsdalei P11 TaxID=1353534 RepID=A0A1A6B483_9CLOT|nr:MULTISPECIES: response regulator [Clostridium]OBR97156.1 oxygen regulatory protein NreC [Clostridium ragsdalei P11]